MNDKPTETPTPFDESMKATTKRLTDATLSGLVVTCFASDLHRILAAHQSLAAQLEEAKKALNICWADSNVIKLDWCADQSPFLAKVVQNIRKHSEYFKTIEATTRPPSPALKAAREALEQCRGAMLGKVSPANPAWHQSSEALALLAKEGV